MQYPRTTHRSHRYVRLSRYLCLVLLLISEPAPCEFLPVYVGWTRASKEASLTPAEIQKHRLHGEGCLVETHGRERLGGPSRQPRGPEDVPWRWSWP